MMYHDEVISGELGQVGTQFDGLGHIGVGDLFYNGNDRKDFAKAEGLQKLGIENVGAIATRGVLRVKLRTDQIQAARTRFAMQVLTVLFGAAVVLFLGWRGVDWATRELVTENPAFALKTIDLQSDGILSAEALRSVAGVRVGENLMALDLARIKRDLELRDYIQAAAVERVLPDTLRIRVTERVPVAQVIVLRPNGRGYDPVPHLLDAAGFVMMPPTRTMVADPTALQIDWLPALTGVNPVDLKPGRQVESAQVRAALRLLVHFERSTMFGRADIRRLDEIGRAHV